MTNFHIGKYPIIFRILNGYILASCPDFEIYVTKRFDEVRKTEEIGALYFELLKKVEAEIRKRATDKKALPSPMEMKHVDSKNTSRILTVQEVSSILQISPDSVRRLSAKRILKSTLTHGGHRRFKEEEVRKYKATLDACDSSSQEGSILGNALDPPKDKTGLIPSP